MIFEFCDEWFPPNVTIGRFTLVKNVMFWGLSSMQFFQIKSDEMNRNKYLSVYVIVMHTTIKVQIYLTFTTMKSHYTIHTEW